MDITKFEPILVKRFSKIGTYLSKYVKYIQRSSKIIITCSVGLLVFSSLINYHYLNYFIGNFDQIAEYYIKPKSFNINNLKDYLTFKLIVLFCTFVLLKKIN